MRVGLLTIINPMKGLWRDAECLLWAIRQHHQKFTVEISVFGVETYDDVESCPQTARARYLRHPAAIAAHTLFIEWIQFIDVLVVCERMMPRTFQYARDAEVRVAYVPNLDWSQLDDDNVEAWIEAVRGSGIDVWAKTRCVQRILENVGITTKLIPWSIPDRVYKTKAPPGSGDQTTCLMMNAGLGGWNNRRGVDIAIQAFALAHKVYPSIKLTIKSIIPIRELVGHLSVPSSVRTIEGFLSRRNLRTLHREHDAVLHPSRWEGFGLPVLESLHAGIPVIATDTCPMNELIVHGLSGLLVKGRSVGSVRLAPYSECDVGELASTIIKLHENPGLKAHLRSRCTLGLAKRQRAFVDSVVAALQVGAQNLKRS